MPGFTITRNETLLTVTVMPVDSAVVCEEWEQWLDFAKHNGIDMIDGEWDWCKLAKMRDVDNICEVVGLKEVDLGWLGFLKFKGPVSQFGYQAMFLSVHPHARATTAGRRVKGVGSALIAYLCMEPIRDCPDEDLELGGVLPESEMFHEKLGAIPCGHDGDCKLYRIPNEARKVLVRRYET